MRIWVEIRAETNALGTDTRDEWAYGKVLSERPENEWKDYMTTSLDSVKVLCSNCHRMIHYKRPALTFDELLK